MNMSLRRTSKRIIALNQEQISYINGCATLQKAIWRMTHRDPLSAFWSQINQKIIKRAFYVLISLREKNRESGLKSAIFKWRKTVETLKSENERLRVLLKMIIIHYNSDTKRILSKYFHKWHSKASKSDSEILEKYGHLFEFLEMLKYYSLFPAKEHFLKNLKNYTSPEYYKKPLKSCFKTYENNMINNLKKAFNKLRLNAKQGELLNLRRKILQNTIISTLNNKDKQALHRALRQWHNKALIDKLLDEFDEEDFNSRIKNMINIYGKWDKINHLNILARAFSKWRLNTSIKKEPLDKRILKAKTHMLKHNINKNAEDLLNSLRDIAEVKKLENLLRKFIRRGPKYNMPLLRKTFRKWYDTAKDMKNNELLRNLKLKYVTNMIDTKADSQIKDILRNAFNIFKRNTSSPKTALLDTEKAIALLRKATVQPFFQKMRENMIKDMNKEKFRALIACYFRQNDKDILHWWFGQWRKNAMKLKIYELKALLLKHVADTKERNQKLKAMRKLKEKMNDYRLKEVIKSISIKNIITKIDKVEVEIDKGMLAKAFYTWKSKVGDKKNKKFLDGYKNGTKLMEKFCLRLNHEDILGAFDDKITIPAIEDKLRKYINSRNNNNNKNLLLKKLYQWKMNCAVPKEDPEQKMRNMFEKYYISEPVQKKLFSGYKNIIKAMKSDRNNKEDAAKKIADYLRGIRDIPNQMRKLKLTKYLMNMIELYSTQEYFKLKYAFDEWSRRARVIKSEEDSRIVQKFIRDRLAKRLKRKQFYEEGIENITKYILNRIFNKIKDKANRNIIPDILIKYFNRKNAKLLELEENSTIIQIFIRQNMLKKLKARNMQQLQDMFKDYIFKLIADMMSTKPIEPDDIEKLVLAIRKKLCREPYDKIMKSLRWKLILEKLKNMPSIYDKYRKEQFAKYMDIWYNNAIVIPNDMANKIQNKFRDYISKKKINDKKIFMTILEKIVIKYIDCDDDKLLFALMKWNKNARKLKCEEDAKIIQKYCRKIIDKAKNNTIQKWKNLAKKIMPHVINQTAKFNNMNKILNNILKRKYFDNLKDFADKKALMDLLKYILGKNDKNSSKLLLRKKLREWLDKTKKMKEIDDDAAAYIQSLFRGYYARKDNKKKKTLTLIMIKSITKISNTSDNHIPAALRKWQKNARLLKCDEDAKIIQRYCRKIMDKIKEKKKNEYLNRIGQGLDVINNLRLNMKYAWDKILDNNKKNALKDLVKFLQDKINEKNRDTFDEIYQYTIDELLRRLITLRKKAENNLLKNALKTWKDNADNLAKLRATEMIQRNWLNHFYDKLKKRLNDLLNDIINRKNESEKDKMRRILKRWNEKANKIAKESAAKRITKFITDYYILTNVKKNWKYLADKLRNKNNKNSLDELRNKLKEYKVLNDLMNEINNNIKRNGLNQLKKGDNWIKIIDALRDIFGDQDIRNNDKIMKRCLRKWLDNANKLKDRDNKLQDALDEIDKRQLIDNVNTFSNASLIKQINDTIPVARVYNFFDRLRNLDKYRKNLLDLKKNLLKKLIKKIFRKETYFVNIILKEWNGKNYLIYMIYIKINNHYMI